MDDFFEVVLHLQYFALETILHRSVIFSYFNASIEFVPASLMLCLRLLQLFDLILALMLKSLLKNRRIFHKGSFTLRRHPKQMFYVRGDHEVEDAFV